MFAQLIFVLSAAHEGGFAMYENGLIRDKRDRKRKRERVRESGRMCKRAMRYEESRERYLNKNGHLHP